MEAGEGCAGADLEDVSVGVSQPRVSPQTKGRAGVGSVLFTTGSDSDGERWALLPTTLWVAWISCNPMGLPSQADRGGQRGTGIDRAPNVAILTIRKAKNLRKQCLGE